MKTLATVFALAMMTTTAFAQDPRGTYPIFSGERESCVVWVVVPFPCHAGFDYVEPQDDGPNLGDLLDREEPSDEKPEEASQVD